MYSNPYANYHLIYFGRLDAVGESVMFLAVNCLCFRQMPRCFEKYGFVTGRSAGTGISSQDLHAKKLGTIRPVASGDTLTTYVLSGTQQHLEPVNTDRIRLRQYKPYM